MSAVLSFPCLGYWSFHFGSQMGNSGAAEATKSSSSLRPPPCSLMCFDSLFKALPQMILLGDRHPRKEPCFRMLQEQLAQQSWERGSRVLANST